MRNKMPLRLPSASLRRCPADINSKPCSQGSFLPPLRKDLGNEVGKISGREYFPAPLQKFASKRMMKGFSSLQTINGRSSGKVTWLISFPLI